MLNHSKCLNRKFQLIPWDAVLSNGSNLPTWQGQVATACWSPWVLTSPLPPFQHRSHRLQPESTGSNGVGDLDPTWMRRRVQDGQVLPSSMDIFVMYIYTYTSSTAQGGGGSFKNRKPIGESGCCESRMAERSHWWTERWLRSPLFLSLFESLFLWLSTYLPTSLPTLPYPTLPYPTLPYPTLPNPTHPRTYQPTYLPACLPACLIYLPTYLPTYLPNLSTYLPI